MSRGGWSTEVLLPAGENPGKMNVPSAGLHQKHKTNQMYYMYLYS